MASGSRKLILIAAGNPLRGDDGVAQRVLQLLPPGFECEIRSVLQWTPELAAEIASYETVVFLDADPQAEMVAMELLGAAAAAAGSSPLTHAANAAEIVALAAALYGFSGKALLCRIPAVDFIEGAGLSERAEHAAEDAALALAKL